ncbi:polysaccharide biosynthesis/export family protein [Veillonella rodentium]|uniref:Polysaccharide export protein Wza n=1 Tax=Veillonella rodentium TaxID=248315 RepID=A0A239YSG7_9FIRM|nr:polysaccharide biosynthesis/export family protein [Veillonella rodentium]SNV61690.1 polysaccharide export protein Wza [Veillonella rodentium]
MNRKQCMIMAAFICVTGTAMAAPVNVSQQHDYSKTNKIAANQVNTPLESSATAVSSDKEYRLRQGDELSIQVVQQADLGTRNGQDIVYAVRPDGYVTFPMVGPVKADGLTVDEFTAQLQQGLSRYIVNPDISVNVTKLGGVRVYVFGEINKPGAYTLTKSSTVIDAIGAAGSFNWDTAKKKIYLIHQNDPEKPIAINLNKMLQTGDMSENYVMREGDILYLTKNSRINFARDIAPILTGAYMVSRIGKD